MVAIINDLCCTCTVSYKIAALKIMLHQTNLPPFYGRPATISEGGGEQDPDGQQVRPQRGPRGRGVPSKGHCEEDGGMVGVAG